MSKMSLITRIRRKIKDRQGQSTTEYILILVIVVMLASRVRNEISGMLTGKITKIKTDIENFEGEP